MKILAKNKRAKFDFELKDTFEAGISLLGSEVKSIKDGKVVLDSTYVNIKNGNANLINMNVSNHESYLEKHEEKRTRRLLLNKHEIKKINDAIKLQRLTVVPTILYVNKRGIIKIEIAIAKGKNVSDKREREKERDKEREIKNI